jgi:pyruvate carboxylase
VSRVSRFDPLSDSDDDDDDDDDNINNGNINNGSGSGKEAGVAADVLVRAPMPCKVVRVCVKAGDTVVDGTVVAVVESMKMELTIKAGFGAGGGGKKKRWNIRKRRPKKAAAMSASASSSSAAPAVSTMRVAGVAVAPGDVIALNTIIAVLK